MADDPLPTGVGKMLTSTQAAAALGVSRSRIHQLCGEERLPGAVHTNAANPRRGEWLIPVAAVEAYAHSRRPAGRQRGAAPFCPQGHAYAEYEVVRQGRRRCRMCEREKQRARDQARKTAS